MTYIQVESFRDFDVLQTDGIYVSEKDYSIYDLMKEFCELENIDFSKYESTEDLHAVFGVYYKKLDETDKFIIFVKSKGFIQIETQKIHFSD